MKTSGLQYEDNKIAEESLATSQFRRNVTSAFNTTPVAWFMRRVFTIDVFKMGYSQQLEEFHGISLIFGESWAGPVASFKASSKSWVLSELFWVKLQGLHETSMLTDLKPEEMDSYKQRATESDALRQQLEATSTSKTATGSVQGHQKDRISPFQLGCYFGRCLFRGSQGIVVPETVELFRLEISC